MTKTLFLLAAILLFIAPASAQDASTIQNTYRLLFVGKVVTIRSFYPENFQKYDEAGNVQRNSTPGPWTLWSKLKVDKFSIDGHKIVLNGNRVFVGTDKDTRKLQLYSTREDVTIEIKFTGAVTTENIKAALDHVLLRDGEHMADIVPDYWRLYFEPELHQVAGDPAESGAPTKEDEERAKAQLAQPRPAPATINHGKPTKVRVSQGVMQGMITSQPKPIYPETAKRYQQSGSVVIQATIDKTGMITNLQVVKPAGLGLDEAAADAVSKWKYKPYLLNGEPIEVETQITVNFTLHG
ncbi:MAG: outer rane transport energization protein TonB [Acidobacteriales bacterium]|nr:outer rane transport energization protein TonB [Terriglobales bacterium]